MKITVTVNLCLTIHGEFEFENIFELESKNRRSKELTDQV